MRLGLMALAVLAIAIALIIALRRSPPPRDRVEQEPEAATPGAPSSALQPSRERIAPPSATAPAALGTTTPPSPLQPTGTAATPSARDREEASLAAWHARSSERDYAYWDMKLTMLRKIHACIGDKMQTLGAAEVNFHFKRQDDAWLADGLELRDPTAEERAKMGAVDFRDADRQLAERCIAEAFAGTTMPVTGGTEDLERYEVRGQIMFPTSADRAWQETGVSP
jgi:hypothetical protein